MRNEYVIIITSDAVTATGSRCVTANVASGKVWRSTGICSRCCGDFNTHRLPCPRCHDKTWRILRRYSYAGLWSVDLYQSRQDGIGAIVSNSIVEPATASS